MARFLDYCPVIVERSRCEARMGFTLTEPIPGNLRMDARCEAGHRLADMQQDVNRDLEGHTVWPSPYTEDELVATLESHGYVEVDPGTFVHPTVAIA